MANRDNGDFENDGRLLDWRPIGTMQADGGLGPHAAKAPKGDERSDERIREDVREAIARQSRLDASDLQVRVEEGVVHLAGTVADRRTKRAIEDLIEHLPGVDDVVNAIRVRRDRSP